LFYQKRIESYYTDAEAFGILFDRLPKRNEIVQNAANAVRPEAKKIITAEDLEKPTPVRELRLRQGDVLTPLAAERAEEKGIRILYQ
jgi:hypothetical protein